LFFKFFIFVVPLRLKLPSSLFLLNCGRMGATKINNNKQKPEKGEPK